MSTIDQFPLEAEISLTELRSEETLTRRLREYHRLRVRRRHDIVGVFIDVDEWAQLVRYVATLEAQAEEHEDAAVRAIISSRLPGAAWEPGSPKAIADIDREYERLVSAGPQP